MSNTYEPIRVFLDAAAREFNDIVDTLATASLTQPIINRPGKRPKRGRNRIGVSSDKGLLAPVQVVAHFRTSELDSLFGPAVQCAAASPLKDPLQRLVEKMARLQLALRQKAVELEDDGDTLPGDFVEKYCQAVAELRRYVGPPGTDPAGAEQIEESDQPPRTRGRKPRYDPRKDKEVAEAWRGAKESGIAKKDFSHTKHLSLKALNRILNRVAKRARK